MRLLLFSALLFLAFSAGMLYHGYQMQHDDSFFDGTVEYENGEVSELLATGTGLSFDINDNGTVDVTIGETSDADAGILDGRSPDQRELVSIDRELTLEPGDSFEVEVDELVRSLTFVGVEENGADEARFGSLIGRLDQSSEPKDEAVFEGEWDDNPMDVATLPITTDWNVSMMFIWWAVTAFAAKAGLSSYVMYRRSRGGG